jgi:hypothetical protein
VSIADSFCPEGLASAGTCSQHLIVKFEYLSSPTVLAGNILLIVALLTCGSGGKLGIHRSTVRAATTARHFDAVRSSTPNSSRRAFTEQVAGGALKEDEQLLLAALNA